jgi:5-methylcytosine-specific restriction endonuclease McrA
MHVELAPVFCVYCGTELIRKKWGSKLEDRTRFINRKYCDFNCMAKGFEKDELTLGGLRSRARKYRGSECEKCKTKNNLAIHHIDSNPKNNSPENLMTLCNSCHMKWHWAYGKNHRKPKSARVAELAL